MVLISKYMFPKGFVGLSLWPLIILREKHLVYDDELLNHERIHLRQQLELLVIPFYVLYLFEWLYGLIKYRNSYTAYKNISFEREAYANEGDLSYLDNRPLWKFLSYR